MTGFLKRLLAWNLFFERLFIDGVWDVAKVLSSNVSKEVTGLKDFLLIIRGIFQGPVIT